ARQPKHRCSMVPPQSAGASSAAPSNMFQCGICARSYSRADHLTRHIRSHTQHKPYTCQHCGKSFGRIDLLRRHVAAHNPENASGKGGRGGRIARGQHLERRVSQACRNCSQNHLRCSDSKPCSRCVKDGLECVWPQQHNQPKHQLPLGQGNSQADDGNQDGEGDLRDDEDVQSPTADAESGRGSLMADSASTENAGPGSANPTAPHLMAMDSGFSRPPAPDSIPAVDVGYSRPPPHNSVPALLPPNMTDHIEPMPHIAVAPPEGGLDAFQVFGHHHHDSLMTDFAHSPRRLPAYAFLNADFDLNDVDLGFLESYNTNIPFNLYFQQESPNTITSPTTTRQDTVGSVSGIAINESSAPTTAATWSQRSRWRFVPNKNDHGGNEEQNLSLPAEHLGTSPESRIDFQQGLGTAEPLRTSTRDKILCMIVENCRPTNRAKAVSSFPSTELLNILIQFYLTSTISMPGSFIHLASFSPNTARPELLAAIIAHGAVMTLDPTFVKLGFAIQECVRVAIPRSWESDNRATRDLELAQAFMINLRIGLWSGDSRKMEIAESFLQPLLTIIRRAGNLQRSRYPPLNLQVLQATENLDEEWKRWVELESWKRLVFQLWLHDADNSIALLVPPLLSYAEFHAPIPDHPSTWRAGGAEEWRRAQLHQLVGSDPNSRNDQSPQFVVKPSIVDYLADFNTVDSVVSVRASVDHRLAKLAFLAGAWRLSWEYNQLKALQRPSFNTINHSLPPAGQTHLRTSFFMTSRYDELHSMLDRFALGQDHSTPEVTLRLEVVRLSLDVPLADVQFFAGLDGPEEARRVHPALRQWVCTPSARRAVAHAGQVVRAARRVSKTDMSGLSATALYHSAQVLLVYGALLREAGVDTPRDATPVFLDGEDREAIERFVHLDRGSPAVRLYDGGASAQQPSSNYTDGVQAKQNQPQQTVTALLSDSPMVLEAVSQVLRSKYEDGRRPILIDSIIQLLTDLGGTGSGV
ncbi:hypothetical protein PpBr36_05021, partial [Pyricularia pennisetigena]|uniref:hypothetical protein n=1 Tax=Pyricularia pennisetigena TaxID=1578925 RepID=UPI00114EF09D